MTNITTIITYPPNLKKRPKGIRAKRAAWAAAGLCTQCGGERPCSRLNHTRKK